MPDVTINVPVDPSGHYFQGVQGKMPGGTQIGSTNYALQHVILVDVNNNPLLVAVAHDAPDSGGGIKIQGRAVVTAPAAVSAVNDRVDAWLDDFGRLTVALKSTTGADQLGGLTETAPASDTASSGLNGRLQRIAQRLTSLIALLPTALGAGGGLKVDGSGTALPVSVADGGHVTLGAKADAKSTATDTTAITAMSVWKQISASVQAIASSVAGTLTVGTHAVTQSGTWTVQPGNTANTTAWKVDGSAVTQPSSVLGTGMMAAAQSVAVGSTSSDGAVVAAVASNRLMGFSFRENASPGAPASFVLRNGTSSSDTPIAYVTLAPGESVREWFGPQGKACAAGIWLDMVSGTVIGQVDTATVA